MIEVAEVSKHYGETAALKGVTFSAPPGAVTGFLGPNGAGKTTALRILLGLARPDTGTALIDGRRYADMPNPRRVVGAVIDSMGFESGRSGRDHLRVVALAAGIARKRVDEVLEFVDLAAAADRAAGGYSQGMRQRLALATALLGDPQVLLLDEPANGLDPAGMAWLRSLLTDWAAQGRTVLFSSHVLTEVEFVADRIVIIDHGRVVRQGTAADLYGAERAVVVRSEDRVGIEALAAARGWSSRRDGSDRLVIRGASTADVGAAVAAAGIVLTELSTQTSTRQLEDLFLDLTTEEAIA
ncbi:MAG TPA: ATP-binding cassette domain-containing protein [Candidatus Limnocylindrales bacterium]